MSIGMRDLSPIVDASPPEREGVWLPLGKKRVKSEEVEGEKDVMLRKKKVEQDQGGKGGKPLVGNDEDEGAHHPDEHKDCPIYEIERPRWFEARFGGRSKLGN
jgi:hypothetical protein